MSLKFKKTNPFLRFNIQDSEYLGRPTHEYKLIQLRMRALVFLLDYGLFISLIYYSYVFINLFVGEVPDTITYVLITFYSMIFVSIEYYFDGTIFKILFNIRNISISAKKLGIHIFILKLFLRPIAFIFAAIYFKFCFAILLWLFGVYKPLFRFLNGKMEALWYDEFIKQVVIKMPVKNA